MTKNKKILLNIIYLLLIILIISLFIVVKTHPDDDILFLLITSFTTFFHFTIRFSFANLIYKIIGKYCTYDRRWFTEKPYEKKLFKILMIRKWKSKLPTWNEQDFNPAENTKEMLLNHICKAEVYHEICMVLSFVPLSFSIVWGEFWIFFWTSVFGCLFDFLFVLIQRYNRPRILRVYNRYKGAKEG